MLQQVTCPVLALIGEKDFQVPPKLNIPELQKHLANSSAATVEEMPGLNHLFQHADSGLLNEYAKNEETFSADVLKQITAWILATPPHPNPAPAQAP